MPKELTNVNSYDVLKSFHPLKKSSNPRKLSHVFKLPHRHYPHVALSVAIMP